MNRNRVNDGDVKKSLLAIIVVIVAAFFAFKYGIDINYKDDYYKQSQCLISFDTGNEVKMDSLVLIT